MRLTKARWLSLSFVTLAVCSITAGMQWITVGMTPGENAVAIQSFDGFSAVPAVSAGLSVAWSSVLVSALLIGKSRSVSIALAAIAMFTAALLTITSFPGNNFPALRDEIERATGIAANHNLTGVSIEIGLPAWLSVAAMLISTLLLASGVRASLHWKPKLKSATNKRSMAPKQDSISLWDGQR